MSQNPYATFGEPDLGTQARTSVLAILSLVCSLLCCIPGLSLLGTLLGSVAIFRISASNGQRRGLGLAIAGIVIGLFISICYIGGWVAISAGIKQMTGVGSVIVENLSRDDAAALRQKLPPARAALLTDERWKRFKDQIEAEIGTVGPLPSNPLAYFRQTWGGFKEYGQAAGRQGKAQVRTMNSNLPPVPLQGTKGDGVLMASLDGDPTPDTDHNLSILNDILVFTSSGKIIRLIDEETDAPAPPSKPKPPSRPAPAPEKAPAPNGV